uniref:Uncharacterized protein n=1 Tax=viral metagenome TaxID=1070528 RepID=A0A6C0JHZ1_9ZZZZ
MEKLTGQTISDYEFIKNSNNKITSAVYPMREHLKNENHKRAILGGSSLVIETGMTRFDELGVPVGLYLEEKHITIENNTKRETKNEIIDDVLFEKLLGMASSVKEKTNSSSKKNVPHNTNKKTKRKHN